MVYSVLVYCILIKEIFLAMATPGASDVFELQAQNLSHISNLTRKNIRSMIGNQPKAKNNLIYIILLFITLGNAINLLENKIYCHGIAEVPNHRPQQQTTIGGNDQNSTRYRRRSEAKVVLCSLILLCGDINPNPGPRPPKFPCKMCCKAVTKTCRAIQCDNCDVWIHNKCSGISDSQYEHFQSDSKLSFICPKCEMPTYLQQIDSRIFCSTNQYDVLDETTLDLSIPSIYSPSSFKPAPFSTSSPDRSWIRNPKEARRGLKVMSINCNSIVSVGKRAEFQSLIQKHQPHVILGQESKLGPEHTNSEIFPKNYIIKRKDRKRGGGGVFILIRDDIDCHEDAFEDITTECEIIWAQVKMPGTKLLNIASVYRPPNTPVSYMAKLQDHLKQVYQKSKSATYII